MAARASAGDWSLAGPPGFEVVTEWDAGGVGGGGCRLGYYTKMSNETENSAPVNKWDVLCVWERGEREREREREGGDQRWPADEEEG